MAELPEYVGLLDLLDMLLDPFGVLHRREVVSSADVDHDWNLLDLGYIDLGRKVRSIFLFVSFVAEVILLESLTSTNLTVVDDLTPRCPIFILLILNWHRWLCVFGCQRPSQSIFNKAAGAVAELVIQLRANFFLVVCPRLAEELINF